MIDENPHVWVGEPVKALDDGPDHFRVGGYLVRFGSPDEPDLQGQYFTRDTDFGPAHKAMILFQHGKDRTLGRKGIGEATITRDDVGLWLEGQIAKSDKYAAAIKALVAKGKLRWSSGTAEHAIIATPVKGGAERIDQWPIAEASLTPTPVEFRGTGAVGMKALDDLAAVKGLHLGEHAEPDAMRSALSSLHYSAVNAIDAHARDPKKTKAQKLKACKGCLDEHHEAAMKCLKAMIPGDGDGDGPPAGTKSLDDERAAWLAAHAPR